MVAIAWDSNVAQGRSWEVHELPPGGQWTQQANETLLNQTAYVRITPILLVRDTPGCSALLDDGQQALWEEFATAVEPLPCP